jgi:hypothetical protein
VDLLDKLDEHMQKKGDTIGKHIQKKKDEELTERIQEKIDKISVRPLSSWGSPPKNR